MQTYKYHCLGDYPKYFQRSDPSDNYSTQAVGIITIHVTYWIVDDHIPG